MARFSKKLQNANHFHIAAKAWCLTKPPSSECVWRVVIWRGEQECEAGKGITTDGVMRHPLLSANNGKEHSSLFSAPCFCSHARTEAPSPPRPSIFSYFLYHTCNFHLWCRQSHFLCNLHAPSPRAKSPSDTDWFPPRSSYFCPDSFQRVWRGFRVCGGEGFVFILQAEFGFSHYSFQFWDLIQKIYKTARFLNSELYCVQFFMTLVGPCWP